MKSFLLLLFLLLLFQPIFAQDYQIVRSDFVRFFADTAGEHHGIKIDSVQVIGADSVFYNYLHVRELENGCELQPWAPSFLGREIIVKPSGVSVILNHAEDSIFINTSAELNNTWSLMNLENGSAIVAEVVGIENGTILDSVVEIKTIELSVIDSLGNSISHPTINNDTIQISDKLGIIRTPDLHLFPDEIRTFQIAGMEKPQRGMHRVDCPSNFAFQVGDELHNHFQNDPIWGGHSSGSKTIRRIVEIELDGNTKTTVWNVARQTYSLVPPSGEYSSSNYLDTTTVIVSVPLASCVGQMPKESTFLIDSVYDEWTESYTIQRTRSQYSFSFCGRPTLTTSSNDLQQFLEDTFSQNGCFVLIPSVSESITTTSKKTYELGTTNYSVEHYSNQGSGGNNQSLIYFKRGNEECGNPYSLSEILSTDERKSNSFGLYPNPIRQGEQIQLRGNQSAQIDVFSVNGQQIPVAFNNGMLQTQNLLSGIYVVRLTSEKGVSTQKLVVTD